MPARRDRDDAVADQLERAARAIREGDAAIYGYDVEFEPVPHESGSVSLPGGRLEFRFEHGDDWVASGAGSEGPEAQE